MTQGLKIIGAVVALSVLFGCAELAVDRGVVGSNAEAVRGQKKNVVVVSRKVGTRWSCKPLLGKGSAIVARKVGPGVGFIEMDGETVHRAAYSLKGLEHRWAFGPEHNYALVIGPGGRGGYYDFTGVPLGTKVKANARFICLKVGGR